MAVLYEVLRNNAVAHPDNIAVVCGDQTLTYGALLDRVLRFSLALSGLGVERGTNVSVTCQNCIEYVVIFFSVAKLEAVLIPINPAFISSELHLIFSRCPVKICITNKANKSDLVEVISDMEQKIRLITICEDGSDKYSYQSLLDDNPPENKELERDGFSGDFITLFSSGSTGLPKRMIRTQDSYVREMRGFIERTETSVQDRNLCTIPLIHSHGVGSCLLPSIGAGATLVLLKQDEDAVGAPQQLFVQRLPEVFELIREAGITLFPGVPYQFKAMADSAQVSADAMVGVRYCFSSGNFLSEEIYESFLKKYGLPVRQIYGCSECGAVAINTLLGEAYDSKSVGHVLPDVSVRIVDESGEELPANQAGEILIKSTQLTRGYEDLPEVTDEAFRGSYFYSGDVGQLDENGALSVVGRKRLLIDTGGSKVDPIEIEHVLLQHQKIQDVVVVGVKGAAGNELIKAVIVAEDGCTESQIREYCRQHLARFKIPRIINFRTELPRNPVGKILRKDLVSSDDLVLQTKEFLLGLLAKSTKVDNSDLSENTSFEDLGIDSQMVLELTALLERDFKFLPKTLFFEHKNIQELSDYLTAHHSEAVQQLLHENGPLDSASNRHEADASAVNYIHPTVQSSRDIAIVGIAGRYPGAEDLGQFWSNLLSGVDCVTEIPENRWNWRDYFDADSKEAGTSYTKWGGFLQGVEQFDAGLFNIPPVEAEAMDPQERLFLQICWQVIEDAGYDPLRFVREASDNNKMGVFAGVMWGDYQLFGVPGVASIADAGNAKANHWSIPNRVSYFFNLNGPSVAVDTACSSSLSAIHLACLNILQGDCNWAIAGGVNLILHPVRYLQLTAGKYASTDGRCRSFGEGGDGYVPAEGVGALLLKPLAAAKSDKDHIYAVIKGSTTNHGGRSKGYTVPNPKSQATALTTALKNADISAQSLSYMEAHGTGTLLGDPIEIRGLNLAFSSKQPSASCCALGSVKSNIGHAEAAAGIAGITKVILQMKHQQLVPTLHIDSVNPNIAFNETPFRLQHTVAPWSRPVVQEGDEEVCYPRRAGVSSFGAGGANTQLVLEEFQQADNTADRLCSQQNLYLFSARTEKSLECLVQKYVTFIDGSVLHTHGGNESLFLRNMAYTLGVGRAAMDSRLAIVAYSLDELRESLSLFLKQKQATENTFIGFNREKANAQVSQMLEGDEGEAYLDAIIDRKNAKKIAQFWVCGVSFDWSRIWSSELYKRIPLPTYAFEPSRHWVPTSTDEYLYPSPSTVEHSLHPLIDSNKSTVNEYKFTKKIGSNDHWVRDYRIKDVSVMSNEVLLAMTMAASKLCIGDDRMTRMSSLEWAIPLLSSHHTMEFQVCMDVHEDVLRYRMDDLTSPELQRLVHQGDIELTTQQLQSRIDKSVELVNLKKQCQQKLDARECYETLRERGVDVGSTSRAIKQIFHDGKSQLVELSPALQLSSSQQSEMHQVALISALGQSVNCSMGLPYGLIYFLKSVQAVEFTPTLNQARWLHIELDNERNGALSTGGSGRVQDLILDALWLDDEGQVLGTLDGVQFAGVESAQLHSQNASIESSTALSNNKPMAVLPEWQLLEKVWQSAELSEACPLVTGGSFVFLVNDETKHLAVALEKGIRDRTDVQSVLVVMHQANADHDLEKHSDHSVEPIEFDFSQADQGSRVVNSILKKSKAVTAVIDLSDCYAQPQSKPAPNAGKMMFVKTLLRNMGEVKLTLVHYTVGLVAWRSRQPTLAGANYAGLVRMLGAEYTRVNSKTIDVDLSISDTQKFVQLIIHELQNQTCQDLKGELCFRDGQWYEPEFKAFQSGTLDDAAIPDITDKLDRDSVYLITGGTGGIGGEIALHLAKHGVRKLALMSYQALPPQTQWVDIASASDTEPSLSRKLSQLLKLKNMGVELFIHSGSLTDVNAIKNYFQQIRKTTNGIKGVVHCAGTTDVQSPAFISKSALSIASVQEPKISGLDVLYEAVSGDSLDFFLLFSSVASDMPRLAVGLSDYANANAYMGYFAEFHTAGGANIVSSILWPRWNDVGMSMSSSSAYQQSGLLPLSTADGLNLFNRVINSNHVQVLPAVVDTQQFEVSDLTTLRNAVNEPIVNSLADTALSNPTVDEVQGWLISLFVKKLKLPENEMYKDSYFADLGIESVLLAELVTEIERDLKSPVEPSILLENTNVSTLTQFMLEQHSASLRRLFDSSTREALKVDSARSGDSTLLHQLIKRESPPARDEKQYKDNTSALSRDSKKRTESKKIAVIGIGCHFPDASDHSQYWSNLSEGRNSVTEVPASRWNKDLLFSSEHKTGCSNSKWGGFIDRIEYFDPTYFNFSESEARAVDPLIRQSLEVGVQCISDAGYTRKELWGKRVGVFIGSRVANFSEKIGVPQAKSVLGCNQNFIAAHLSHYFNFTGNSLVVDTACSSSLVSIHLACQNLLAGESELALAGGVDILLDEQPYLFLSASRAFSPDGKCKTFDETANGFVPGEGCGMVLLKTLEMAISDGDKIYGVIDSSSVNNDGNTMGVTTPNPEAQKTLIQNAMDRASTKPDTFSYIEAHGTGTMIGDPIELKALTEVFRQHTNEKAFCAVGSVKSNMGHLLSAAGIASFIKVILSLHHKTIVPTLHCTQPNPRFNFSESPFYASTERKPWVPRNGVRRAGISAFGFGGTNAHVIVSDSSSHLSEEYVPQRTALPPAQYSRSYHWYKDDRSSAIPDKEDTRQREVPVMLAIEEC